MYIYIKISTLLILVITAAVIDYRSMKIPNMIFFIGMTSFVIFDFYLVPLTIEEILYKVFWIVFLFFFGMLHLIGMGDIKLWMVLTAYLGIVKSSLIICFASILLIIVQFVTNKQSRGLIFLLVSQFMTKQKIKIVEQKSYAFAPYIAALTIAVCILMLTGVIK